MEVAVVETLEWETEHEVSIELNDGDILTATGKTVAEALRNLADEVENHP